MQIEVQQIAELFSGIYVNTSAYRGQAVYYLQMRHWDRERKWIRDVEAELCEEKRFNKNYLQSQDLLLATKGTDPFAALYDGRYQPAIASSVFTVMRILDPTKVLPTYLQWYLNHPWITKTLVAASRGTSIPLITRDVIEGLQVPVPSVKKQELIVAAHRLRQQSTRIRSQMNQLNESLFEYQLLQTANR